MSDQKNPAVKMLPLSQEEILERRNIGRNCIPGTNKIDTARRSVSLAEDREAAVKTYAVLLQRGVRSGQR